MSKERTKTSAPIWSEEEIQNLHDLLNSVPRRAVARLHARKFKRSERAVREWIYKYQCPSCEDTVDLYGMKQLTQIFDATDRAIESWLRRGLFCERPKTQKHKDWFVTEKQIKEFCIKHPDLARSIKEEWHFYFFGKPKPQYWNGPELGKALFASESTVRLWRQRGWLTPVWSNGSSVLYDRRSLEEFLDRLDPELKKKYGRQVEQLLGVENKASRQGEKSNDFNQR